MTALLDHPLPSFVQDETLSRHAAAVERAVLESLARTGARLEVRTQALVDLMALEAACGDELAFLRIRHELFGLDLPPAVVTPFRVQVTWGLVRFGRLAAARRWAQHSTPR